MVVRKRSNSRAHSVVLVGRSLVFLRAERRRCREERIFYARSGVVVGKRMNSRAQSGLGARKEEIPTRAVVW